MSCRQVTFVIVTDEIGVISTVKQSEAISEHGCKPQQAGYNVSPQLVCNVAQHGSGKQNMAQHSTVQHIMKYLLDMPG